MSCLSKGQRCVLNGRRYEQKVHSVLLKTKINGNPFNTQAPNELGSSNNRIDIQCNYNKINDLGIEVKTAKSPDWMQCSITYDKKQHIWHPVINGKIPDQCRKIFHQLICDNIMYDNNIPPFLERKLKYNEWKDIKSIDNKWKDIYINIPSTIISELYRLKGCSYIQISHFGLYHTGIDTCGFNVPMFKVPQRIRIRVKIHRTVNSNGYCDLSVMCGCQPKYIFKLEKSPYSLDNLNKLPRILTSRIN